MKTFQACIFLAFALSSMLTVDCSRYEGNESDQETKEGMSQQDNKSQDVTPTTHSRDKNSDSKDKDVLEEVYDYLERKRGAEPIEADSSLATPKNLGDWLKKEMARRKIPFEKMGYKQPASGIKSGHIGVCGYFLPRPYSIGCVPFAEDSEDARYKLTANGIRLNTTSCHAYFKETSVTKVDNTSDDGLAKRQEQIYRKLDVLKSRIMNLPIKTGSSVVERLIKSELDSIRKQPEVRSITMKSISDNRGIRSFSIIYALKEQKPAIGIGFTIPMPRKGISMGPGKVSILPKSSCEYHKEEVIRALRANSFVQQGPNVKPDGDMIVKHIVSVLRSDARDETKYWLLLKLGARCPVCYLTNK